MKLLLPATIATTFVALLSRLSDAASVLSSNVETLDKAKTASDDTTLNLDKDKLRGLIRSASEVLGKLEETNLALGLKRRDLRPHHKTAKRHTQSPTSSTQDSQATTIENMHTGTFTVTSTQKATIKLVGNTEPSLPTEIILTPTQIQLIYGNHKPSETITHQLSTYGLGNEKSVEFKLYVGGELFGITSPGKTGTEEIIGSVRCENIGKCSATISGVSVSGALYGRRLSDDGKQMNAFKEKAWVLPETQTHHLRRG